MPLTRPWRAGRKPVRSTGLGADGVVRCVGTVEERRQGGAEKDARRLRRGAQKADAVPLGDWGRVVAVSSVWIL